MFDDAQAFEDQVEPPPMAIEPPTWAVKANGEARLEVSSFFDLFGASLMEVNSFRKL